MADDAADFEPSEDQLALRDIAVLATYNARKRQDQPHRVFVLADGEQYAPVGAGVADWIVAADHLMGDDAPTMRDWRAWTGEPGFTDWLLEALPHMAEVTEFDIQMLTGLWVDQVRRGVAQGDADCMKLFVAWRKGQKEVDGSALGELREVIEEASATSQWHPPKGQT